MLDYYALLGVEPDAPRESIRAAYRVLVARAHPDINAAPDAERETALLNEAWSVLREPSARAAYDAAGLATSAPMRCQGCGGANADLRFVTFARTNGVRPPLHDGALVCSSCRKREARSAAFASVLRGRYDTKRGRRVTFGAIARDMRGGKIDARTSAALLRQLGFAYARENRSSDALATLEAVLELGPDPAVDRIVARLREAGATTVETRVESVAAPAARAPRSRGAFYAIVTAVVLLGIVAVSYASLRRTPTSFAVAASASAPSRNVDAALGDDAARLARLVRPDIASSESGRFLFDLPNDVSFARAYGEAIAVLPLGDRTRHPWVVTLETTSEPGDAAKLPRADDYVLARGCDPQACNDGFVSVAYDVVTHAVAGAAYFDGRWHEFGSTDPADRAMVVLDVARSHLPLERRFALDPASEAELGEYVAQLH